jgi:2-polyprenyl-3-methyl-5-hydroxy-6-metoxy-1,4-benzoquinol methylase
VGSILAEVVSKISRSNPIHAKKLSKTLQKSDPVFVNRATTFLKKYTDYLHGRGKDLDYAIECYLKMVADMTHAHVRFIESGEYASKAFGEVNQRVYSNPEIMEYYMNGLILSQFLWAHHYVMFSFFVELLQKYKHKITRYLEIGGGHGLFISEAINILNKSVQFDLVDISPASIEMAKSFIGNKRVNFILSDVFEYEAENKYDFITMGEVLEHVERPDRLLAKLKSLLNDDGYVYVTVPANAPAIDHIYLFKNARDIRETIEKTGFEIIEDKAVYAEDVSQAKAEKLKITLMYGALLRMNPRSL